MSDTHEKDPEQAAVRCNRRGFIKSMGLGVMAMGLECAVHRNVQAAEHQEVEAGSRLPIVLQVNGRSYRLLAEPRWTLLFVLREKLGLTGSKEGCGRGECGACTVLIDDAPRYACLTLAVEAQNCRIETVEGLMQGEQLGQVQEAFLEEDALQCGYCTPGQVVAAEGLLRLQPNPDDETIRRGMSGNLCRCGAYEHIARAVNKAAKRRSG
jgi:xanthine dehydrogenase YagT iron-sulfur-binding subunit